MISHKNISSFQDKYRADQESFPSIFTFWGNALKLCFCWNLKRRAIPTCCLSLGISLPAVLSAMGIEAAAGTCGPCHHRMTDFGSASCSEGHSKPSVIPWLVQQGPVQEDGKDSSGSKHSRYQHLALVCDNLSEDSPAAWTMVPSAAPNHLGKGWHWLESAS